MPSHLTHLFMEVASLERARWFWIDALGLELLEDRGPYIRVGGNGGFSIGIEQVQAGAPRIDGDEIALRVDDVDATAEQLRALGVQITQPPHDQPWGDRHAWLLDPDGRQMSIYSPAA